jgi:UDP-3-O-[3-hydroxymyristoyl] glucosamine N-acyltransferase
MISTDTLAKEFDLTIVGSSRLITNIGSLTRRNNTSLLWSKNADLLGKVVEGIVVCTKSHFDLISPHPNTSYLITDKSPRFIFAKIVAKHFNSAVEDDIINHLSEHKKNPKIKIAENVFIASNVEIGDGTIIHHGVVIHSNTIIGKNCIIKANASIGTEGLGLEMDSETNRFMKFPQIGGVIISDDVEIGPSSTIRRSALDATIIGKGTKIGALCNIGHNCIIGENCILTCNVVTSGSSVIQDNVFMGVGSLIKQGINVGKDVTLGIGAIVVKNVPDGETWVGNPAKCINKVR